MGAKAPPMRSRSDPRGSARKRGTEGTSRKEPRPEEDASWEDVSKALSQLEHLQVAKEERRRMEKERMELFVENQDLKDALRETQEFLERETRRKDEMPVSEDENGRLLPTGSVHQEGIENLLLSEDACFLEEGFFDANMDPILQGKKGDKASRMQESLFDGSETSSRASEIEATPRILLEEVDWRDKSWKKEKRLMEIEIDTLRSRALEREKVLGEKLDKTEDILADMIRNFAVANREKKCANASAAKAMQLLEEEKKHAERRMERITRDYELGRGQAIRDAVEEKEEQIAVLKKQLKEKVRELKQSKADHESREESVRKQEANSNSELQRLRLQYKNTEERRVLELEGFHNELSIIQHKVLSIENAVKKMKASRRMAESVSQVLDQYGIRPGQCLSNIILEELDGLKGRLYDAQLSVAKARQCPPKRQKKAWKG